MDCLFVFLYIYECHIVSKSAADGVARRSERASPPGLCQVHLGLTNETRSKIDARHKWNMTIAVTKLQVGSREGRYRVIRTTFLFLTSMMNSNGNLGLRSFHIVVASSYISLSVIYGFSWTHGYVCLVYATVILFGSHSKILFYIQIQN